MVRILALGGVPAAGKTTIARNVIASLGFPERSTFKFGLVNGHYSPAHKCYVLGTYGEGLFAGTDKLSMAVQPDAIKFVNSLAAKIERYSIFFEGDRLFNSTFLSHCRLRAEELRIIVVEADPETLRARHDSRGDDQKEAFLKRCATKLANIEKAQPFVKKVRNESEFDSSAIAFEIKEYLWRK